MPNRKTNYDPQALALDLVMGRETMSQIAAKHGLSDRYIEDIKYRGAAVKVQEAMVQIREGMKAAAIQIGASYLESLIKKQIKVGIEDDTDVGRKCREFLIGLMLGDHRVPNITFGPGATIVSDPLVQFIGGLDDEAKQRLIDADYEVSGLDIALPEDSGTEPEGTQGGEQGS